MLKLFVSATTLALPLVLAIVLPLVNRPYAPIERRDVGRITATTAGVGLAAAGVLSWLRLNTSVLNLPRVNLWLGVLAVVSALIFLIAVWVVGSRPLHDAAQDPRHRALLIASHLALLTGTTYFALPYLLTTDAIVLMGGSLWETQSLLRLTGFTLASVMLSILAYVIAGSLSRMPWLIRSLTSSIAVLVLLGPRTVLLYQSLATSGAVPRNRSVFNAVLFIQRHESWILLALAAVAILPGLIALKTPAISIAAPNPAEVRLHRADQLSRRKFAVASLGLGAALAWTLIDGKRRSEAVPVLSEIEPSVLVGNEIRVSRELVSDGHLHRFAYQAADGTQVRFIVIKKNEVAFGTGLDACEICGDSGYYEERGRVICAECDVAMNIQTIGFRGGCNPIPIGYEQDADSLIFSAQELESHTNVFR